MADKKATNQQILEAVEALGGRFDGVEGRFDGLERRFDGLEGRFDGLEGRFDKLEKMVAAIGDTVGGIPDNMATSKELEWLREELGNDFDNLELRLGRRIDTAILGKTIR